MRWLRNVSWGQFVLLFLFNNFLFCSPLLLMGLLKSEKKHCDVIYFHFSPNETFVRERATRINQSTSTIFLSFFFILGRNGLFKFHGQQLSLNVGFVLYSECSWLVFCFHTISEVRRTVNEKNRFSFAPGLEVGKNEIRLGFFNQRDHKCYAES